jgi:hypothetical protein
LSKSDEWQKYFIRKNPGALRRKLRGSFAIRRDKRVARGGTKCIIAA